MQCKRNVSWRDGSRRSGSERDNSACDGLDAAAAQWGLDGLGRQTSHLEVTNSGTSHLKMGILPQLGTSHK